MPRKIEIGDDVAEVIDDIGGTFDSVDDVLRQILAEAGYSLGDDSWSETELEGYFDSTDSEKQMAFLRALVESDDDWVPKAAILDRIQAELGENAVTAHTLDGVQSSLTRRCQSAGNEKFWERRRADGLEYRIKPSYQEVAHAYWST